MSTVVFTVSTWSEFPHASHIPPHKKRLVIEELKSFLLKPKKLTQHHQANFHHNVVLPIEIIVRFSSVILSAKMSELTKEKSGSSTWFKLTLNIILLSSVILALLSFHFRLKRLEDSRAIGCDSHRRVSSIIFPPSFLYYLGSE